MTGIDKRIVKMEFDNQQFETNVQTSVKTLDKLKSGLNLDASAKSLANLGQVGKNFSLAGVSQGVDALANRFSTLGIVGMTAIQNITNSAIAAGETLVKSLTIDPIKSGFSEYENKVKASKTMMSGTGESIGVVSDALNDLNTYSDRTIYSFKDMTANISKFTNSGLKSKEAATAIIGISNVAASAGANAEEAGRAMYQLGQAMSGGFVGLMDWNSVENSNMATVEFKNQLIQTALAAGTLKKGSKGMYVTPKGTEITATKGFNLSLQDQWMTTEVLSKTLRNYGDETTAIGKKAYAAAQEITSGTQLLDILRESVAGAWTSTWQTIFGDAEQAKLLWTSVSNVISPIIASSGENRNKLLSGWSDLGGRQLLIEGLSNTFKGLLDIIRPIGEAFREMFPAMTAERLVAITKSFRDLTQNFKMGEETTDKLKRTFKGVYAIFDIGWMAISALAQAFGFLIKTIWPITGGFISATATMGDFLVGLDATIRGSNTFVFGLKKLGNGIMTIVKGLKFIKMPEITFPSLVTERLASISNEIKYLINNFKLSEDTIDKISRSFKGLIAVFDIIITVISAVVMVFAFLIKTIGGGLLSITAPMGDFLVGFANGIRSSDAFAVSLKKVETGLTNMFQGFKVAILDKYNNAITNICGVLNRLKEAYKSLGLTTMQSVGVVGLSVVVVQIVRFITALVKLFRNFGSISESIVGVLDGVTGCLETFQSSLKANVIKTIAISIAILAAALFLISTIDKDKLISSLGAVAGLFVALFAAMSGFNAILSKSGSLLGMAGLAGVMIGMAIAVLILSFALKKLSGLDLTEMAKGMVGLTGMMLIMLGASKALAENTGNFIEGAFGLTIFAVSLIVLGKALERVGKLPMKDIAKGLLGLGVAMGELALFIKYSNLGALSSTQGWGLLLMASAILTLTKALEKLSLINSTNMFKGLLSVGLMLGEIAYFLKSVGDGKDIIAKGTALLIIAVSINILALAIGKLGSMPIGVLVQGLVTLGVAIGILTGFMYALSKMDGAQTAIGLVVIAAAIIGLTYAIQTLGQMPLENIKKALFALAGGFAIIGVSVALMAPIAPAIAILGGALLLVGLAMLSCGVGVLALSTGLAALAAIGPEAANAVKLILITFTETIPAMMKAFALGIVEFIKSLGDSAPVLAESFKQIIMALLNTITTMIPAVVDSFFQLITSILTSVQTFLPKFIQMGFDIIINFLKGIKDNIKEVTVAAIEVILNFIDGIKSKLTDIVNSGVDLIINFVNGMANAIRNNSGPIIDATINLIDSMIDILKAALIRFIGAGEEVVEGFIKGIKNKIDGVWEWGTKLGTSALDAAKKALDSNSPSKKFEELGMFSAQGFAGGLKKYAGLAAIQAKNVGTTAMSALSGAVSNISDLVNGDIDINPTIRPVIDMTDVNAGLSSTFDKTQGINVASININAMAVNQRMPSNNQVNLQPNAPIQNNQNGIQLVKHSGTLRVEGINNRGELVAVVTKIFEQGNLSLPTGMRTLPSIG